MKIRFLVFFIAFVSYSLYSQALTIQSGQTYYVTPSNNIITAVDIIIESGGVLNMQGGSVVMGEGTKILVEAGGQIIGQGGSIQKFGGSTSWEGIFLDDIGTDGTNAPHAIDILDVNISGANIGIRNTSFQGGISCPAIKLKEVTMENNIEANIAIASSHSYENGSKLINCHIYAPLSAYWSVWIGLFSTFDIYGCTFEGSSTFHVHADHPRKFKIQKNEFNEGALGLHYDVFDCRVWSNTFNVGAGDTAIDLSESVTTSIEKINIADNEFIGNDSSIGINMKFCASVKNVAIYQNRFLRSGNGDSFNTAIAVQNAVENEHKSNNSIWDNYIEYCNRGIRTYGVNSSLQISCNIFINNMVHLEINDHTDGSFGLLEDQCVYNGSYYAPKNLFKGATNDIVNNTSDQFIYSINTSNSSIFHPSSNINVNIVNTLFTYDCRGTKTRERESVNNFVDDKVLAFPNPAQNYFSIKTDVRFNSYYKVEITDVLGVTRKMFTYNEKAQYDISDLSSGNYFIRITSKTGTVQKSMKLIKSSGGLLGIK